MQSYMKISHHQGALKQCAAVMIWPILVYEWIFGEIYIFLYTQQGEVFLHEAEHKSFPFTVIFWGFKLMEKTWILR